MRFFEYLFLFFLFTLPARAEILLEPLVAYNLHSKLDVAREDNYSGGGTGFGGRAGYQKLGFQLGVDYLHSDLDFDDSDFGKNVTMDEFAGFVGFEFPFLIRVYGGYIFAANGDSSYRDSTIRRDFELSGGTGSKFGIGFTGLPFVCINLEYRQGEFDEYDLGNTTVNEKVKYSAYLLSVSLPFVF